MQVNDGHNAPTQFYHDVPTLYFHGAPILNHDAPSCKRQNTKHMHGFYSL